MAAFKLPRLKANLAIVNGKGWPTDYFLRLFNIELAQRIEQNETEQNEILARLVAAEEAAAAAQATADEALAAAESGGGSKYVAFSGPYPTVQQSVNAVAAQSRLQFSGAVDGATIDADTAWVGRVDISESNGTTTLALGSVPITLTSTGDVAPGPSWTTDPGQFSLETIGSYAGSVTYIVTVVYESGANLVEQPDISVTITLTPKAT